MKSYRSRSLNRRCQLAKSGHQGGPLRDEHGNYVLDHGGAFFLHVSGNDHHDRKRLVPADPEGFFRQRAEEATVYMRSKGKSVTVTPEMVYREYSRRFTKPQYSYAPPGHPEEFSVVVQKELCVNWSHGGFRGTTDLTDIAFEEMSFSQTDAVEDVSDMASLDTTTTTTTAEVPTSRRRGKGRNAQPVTVGDDSDSTSLLDI